MSPITQLASICTAYGSQPVGRKKEVVIPVSEVMAYLGFDEDQEDRLRNGQILSKSMTDREKTAREIAIASVMIIVRRPLDVVAEVFLSGDSFRVYEKVLAFHEISNQAKATGAQDDFSGIRFSDEEKRDKKRLSQCKPGNIFNLSENEIGRFKNIDKDLSDPSGTITKTLRSIIHNRYKRYIEGGLSGIDPYARKKGRFVFPGKELRSAIDAMVIAKKHLPEFHQTLLDFPHAKSDNIDSKFYWLKLSMQNRPNFLLAHQLGDSSDEYAIVVEKIYYSLHTLDSSLIVIGCLPCDEGAVVFYMNHLFTDKVLGFAHNMKRNVGKKAIANSVSAYFGRLRGLLEGQKKK